MTISEAATSLRRRLDPHMEANHWVVSIGVGDDHITVFVVSRRWADHVPAEWEGFPVRTIASGRMRLC